MQYKGKRISNGMFSTLNLNGSEEVGMLLNTS